MNKFLAQHVPTQVSEIASKSVTTIEGLSADSSHPLQKAWLAEQVPSRH